MDREVVYTKDRLRFVLHDLLQSDIGENPQYLAEPRAEEGFEKRAALEFLLWFLEQAIPDNASFPYRYEHLEQDYPEPVARAISEGRGWAARALRRSGGDDNIVLGDFRR